jgi:hypothetical protein
MCYLGNMCLTKCYPKPLMGLDLTSFATYYVVNDTFQQLSKRVMNNG